ncbi:MAG: hypothetical protein ACO218_11570 [Steroidobacteraceae bacterium]
MKQSLLRVFRASVTEAIRRAVAFDDGLEVAEVLDCLEELTADLASGHLIEKKPLTTTDRSCYTEEKLQKRIEATNQMLRETLDKIKQNTDLMEQIADYLDRKREEP